MSTNGFSAKLRELLPRVRERREEIEEARQLPHDIVSDLAASGVFKLGLLSVYGGDEASPTDLMRAYETVSVADGSTGWVTMIGAGGALFAGMMDETGFKEVFADPSWPTAATVPPKGVAVPVEGGFKLSGRWPFASGIMHCDWVAAGCVILYDGQPRMTPMGIPEVIWGWMPTSDIEIHDTWYVSGLRGTGSNDYSGKDVFVPQHRTFHLFDTTNHRSEPTVRLPGVAGFAAQVASVGLGIARAALDDLIDLAGGKMPTMSTTSLAAKAATQIEVAALEGKLAGARSFLYDSVDDVWETLLAGSEYTPRQNALVRLAACQAAETSAAVAHRVNTIAGGNSLYLSSSIQRHARDADAVTHHFVVSPATLEDAGRVLLGLEPSSPLF
jgi:alkylation response protein AidB-like acyl-CoA dehydrogenase